MNLTYQLRTDPRGYLTVNTSFVAIYADDQEQVCLCHVDYERNKGDGYPEAHLQIHGESEALELMLPNERRGLARLHFPVGGRRYRPSLEDVIEFLVAERLVQARSGYQQVLETARAGFHKHQLRAAMARYPDIVDEFFRDCDAGRIGPTG